MRKGELSALRVQDWMWAEYEILVPVQEIERAMTTPRAFEDPVSPIPYNLTTDGRAALGKGK